MTTRVMSTAVGYIAIALLTVPVLAAAQNFEALLKKEEKAARVEAPPPRVEAPAYVPRVETPAYQPRVQAPPPAAQSSPYNGGNRGYTPTNPYAPANNGNNAYRPAASTGTTYAPRSPSTPGETTYTPHSSIGTTYTPNSGGTTYTPRSPSTPGGTNPRHTTFTPEAVTSNGTTTYTPYASSGGGGTTYTSMTASPTRSTAYTPESVTTSNGVTTYTPHASSANGTTIINAPVQAQLAGTPASVATTGSGHIDNSYDRTNCLSIDTTVGTFGQSITNRCAESVEVVFCSTQQGACQVAQGVVGSYYSGSMYTLGSDAPLGTEVGEGYAVSAFACANPDNLTTPYLVSIAPSRGQCWRDQ